jgi:hypothetical protein
MSDLERFYSFMNELRSMPGQGQPLSNYTGKHPWPKRGVYFFEEPGECRSTDPTAPRIVRVGTHAVSAGSKATLWSRLRAHRGQKSGGGNQRGSIFRHHVGVALLNKDRATLESWVGDKTGSPHIRALEREHEQRVSAYLGTMRVMWCNVPDDASAVSERAIIERNAIALLSNALVPWDAPSNSWLGLFSPNDRIKRSGLWNLKHVEDRPVASFLGVLEKCVPADLKTSLKLARLCTSIVLHSWP